MWTDRGLNMKVPGVGVVVARFHTDNLHEGHMALLHTANLHANLLVLLGCSKFPLTKKNPLDFPTRKQMVQAHFPSAVILPIYDKQDDIVWSNQLDSIIKSVFPFQKAILYGSRDSFVSHYSGKFPIHVISEIPGCAATNTRELLGSQPIADPKFRAGVIYASQNLHPRVNPTVDIGIWKKVGRQKFILLGRKEGSSDWYFPGGFVDPADPSLEYAACRETFEETNLNTDHTELVYKGSYKVPDWRTQEDCTIMTSFFAAQWNKSMGTPQAGDDLKEVAWFPLKEAQVGVHHGYLLQILKKYLENR